MALIFTTSTIATIAFLQIGRDWLEKGELRDAYIQNGYAMSVFWSACYTGIFVSILLIPFFWVGSHVRHFQRQAKFSGDELGYYDQLYDAASYQFMARAGAAILTPIFTSSFAAVLGS